MICTRLMLRINTRCGVYRLSYAAVILKRTVYRPRIENRSNALPLLVSTNLDPFGIQNQFTQSTPLFLSHCSRPESVELKGKGRCVPLIIRRESLVLVWFSHWIKRPRGDYFPIPKIVQLSRLGSSNLVTRQ